jgi:AcrR family transcriptional regulator
MALYRHVRDKDELLVLLIDRRAALLPVPDVPADADPRTRLLALYTVLYDGLSASPWVVDVLVKGDLIAPSVLRIVDGILAAFLDAGLTPERTAVAYHAAWRYTLGEVKVRSASAQHLSSLDRPPMVRSLIAAIDPAELPSLTAVGPQLQAQREASSFDEGLSALIGGLLVA